MLAHGLPEVMGVPLDLLGLVTLVFAVRAVCCGPAVCALATRTQGWYEIRPPPVLPRYCCCFFYTAATAAAAAAAATAATAAAAAAAPLTALLPPTPRLTPPRRVGRPTAPLLLPDGGQAAVRLQDVCFKPFGDECATQSVLQYWRLNRTLYETEQVGRSRARGWAGRCGCF